MPTALLFATKLLAELPALLELGTTVASVIDLARKGKAKLDQFEAEKREPTQAEWDELNASIFAKRAELHAP